MNGFKLGNINSQMLFVDSPKSDLSWKKKFKNNDIQSPFSGQPSFLKNLKIVLLSQKNITINKVNHLI